MQELMTIEIYSPEGQVYTHQGRGCQLDTVGGGIGILPNHIPIMVPLEIGAVVVTRRDNEYDYIAVDGGMASFQNNHLTIVATYAIRARDIDNAAVEIARQEAEAALYAAEAHGNEKEYRRAQVALSRAINQINVSQHRR